MSTVPQSFHSLSGPGSNAGQYVALSNHVSLDSFSLEQYPSLSCSRTSWTGLKDTGLSFQAGTSVWVCTCFLGSKLRPCFFDRNYTKMMLGFSSTWPQGAHDVSPSHHCCFNFNHLVTSLSDTFLHCKGPIFPFVAWGQILRLCYIHRCPFEEVKHL